MADTEVQSSHPESVFLYFYLTTSSSYESFCGAFEKMVSIRHVYYFQLKRTANLRIQSATVSRLVHPQYSLDPRDHLVTAGIGGLVQADVAGLDIVNDVTLQRRGAVRKRCVVIGPERRT